MRSEYFTLFRELSCLFNLAYQAKAGVYFDIFFFSAWGITGHGFSYLYQDRRRVIHSSYLPSFFYACCGASGGFICFFRVAELLYSTYDSLIPIFHEYIIEFTVLQSRYPVLNC
jgi:hypothetical protein